MGGRRAIILIVVLSGSSALAAGSGSPRATARSPRPLASTAEDVDCGPPAARTLAASRTARVYSLHGQVYGCSVLTGRSFVLDSAGPVAVAGNVAAYGFLRVFVDTSSASVIVRRLTDGRRLRNIMAVNGGAGPEQIEGVDSIVVKSDGAVAWIGGAASVLTRQAIEEVHRVDRRGARLLDSGSRIARRSLQLHRARLTWRHAGRVRSATLR